MKPRTKIPKQFAILSRKEWKRLSQHIRNPSHCGRIGILFSSFKRGNGLPAKADSIGKLGLIHAARKSRISKASRDEPARLSTGGETDDIIPHDPCTTFRFLL